MLCNKGKKDNEHLMGCEHPTWCRSGGSVNMKETLKNGEINRRPQEDSWW